LMAFVVLDRELKRSRPAWRAGYRLALLAVPGLLLLLVWRWYSAPDLAGDDPITTRIARHAGSDLLAGVSSHLLVATHTFLEMLHYGVWLVALPLASCRSRWALASRGSSCSGWPSWPTIRRPEMSISTWRCCMSWPRSRSCCG
jgi:hypothetical protein